MDGAKCILQLRGVRPFLSNKYDIDEASKVPADSPTTTSGTPLTSRSTGSHKLVVKPDDTFDLYDMGEVEAD